MPIINITQKDIDRQKPPENGWHLAELQNCVEEASKDGKSINYKFEYQVVDGNSLDRYAYTQANSKAIGMVMLPMISALLDIPIDDVKKDQYDTDKLLKKRCWIEVFEEPYEGRLIKKIKGFVSANSKPPF